MRDPRRIGSPSSPSPCTGIDSATSRSRASASPSRVRLHALVRHPRARAMREHVERLRVRSGRISSAETLVVADRNATALPSQAAAAFASASHRAVSARAASTSGGKSTSPHSSPLMSSVHTSPLLREVMDHPQIPDGRALGRAHRPLDRLAEPLGAARAEGEQPDRLGVDAFGDALADRAAAARPRPDDLHVVVVVAVGLAVDRHANPGCRLPTTLRHQLVATPKYRRSTPGNRRPAPRAP